MLVVVCCGVAEDVSLLVLFPPDEPLSEEFPPPDELPPSEPPPDGVDGVEEVYVPI